MAGVPTVKVRAQVRVDEERSMGESESVALVGPGARDALKQQLDGQSPGPATFGDGLDDVRGEIARPQNPADMGVAQAKASRDLGGVRVFAIPQTSHPTTGLARAPGRAHDRRDGAGKLVRVRRAHPFAAVVEQAAGEYCRRAPEPDPGPVAPKEPR